MGYSPSTRGVHVDQRVSVVLATFNGERYLGEQLASLLHQRRLPDEVIVIDDASTDGTVRVIEEFAEHARFDLHVVARTDHLGTSATFEEAISRATGDVVLICDQDDRWRGDKIEVMLDALEAHPHAMLAFSDSRLIDAGGKMIDRSRWRVAGFSSRERRAMTNDPFGQMLARQIVSGCTAAIRSELVPAILPFPEDLHPALGTMVYDRWTSLVAAAHGPVVLVNDQLVDYRIHPDQQIGIPGLPFRLVAPRATLHVAQFIATRSEIAERSEYYRVHLDEIAKRLEHAGLATAGSRARLRLADNHLQSRFELDPVRSRRARPVFSELRNSDGYRRFTLGAATALADLTR